MALPPFNEHEGHEKLSPLTGPTPPWPSIESWLSRLAEPHQRSSLRVLDVGCGKGGTVAWLLAEGFDAYGLDVRPDYIANGRAYLGDGRLAVLEEETYPYPDNFFDVVISNQVLEHVADLDQLAREVARTTKPGAVGLHVFPAKWTINEPHMHVPLVHWLPKGRLRRGAMYLALRAGLAAPYFLDRAPAERTAIYSDYSEQETFYRRPAEIRRALRAAGLIADIHEVSREQVHAKLGNPRLLPKPIHHTAAWLYRNTRMMYVTTVKAASPV